MPVAPVLITPPAVGTPDELAALQRLDRVAEDLGVAEAVLVAQDDDRLGPGRVDPPVLRVALASASRDRDGVGGLRERRQQMIGRGPATVFADVDDQARLASTCGIEFFLELVEARHAHPLDVEIAERSLGELVDGLAVVLAPTCHRASVRAA